MEKSIVFAVLIVKLVVSSEDCSQNEFRFQIFETRDIHKTLVINNCTSSNASLNSYCKSDSKVKLIVHGFTETWRMTVLWDWVNVMKNELFNLPEYQSLCVIALDWSELASGGVIPDYWKAINNLNIIDESVADVFNNSHFDAKNVHCIGFSLGAHLCSMIYKKYYSKYHTKLGRLTGLDPAGPFFVSKNNSERLYYEDADFVDVIHTSNDFGIFEKSGHMDFYTNIDKVKVNTCTDIHIQENENKFTKLIRDIKNISAQGQDVGEKIKTFFISVFEKTPEHISKSTFAATHQYLSCQHLMAVRLFIYSINYCKYQSEYCNFNRKNCVLTNDTNYPRMGYHADKSDSKYKFSNGTFYVNTSLKMPFCYDINPNMIDIVNNYHDKIELTATKLIIIVVVTLFILIVIFALIRRFLCTGCC